MMRMHYDPEADAFPVHFAPKGAYLESEEVAPGIVLDFDATGQVVGIEVLGVHKRMASVASGEVPLPVEKPAAE